MNVWDNVVFWRSIVIKMVLKHLIAMFCINWNQNDKINAYQSAVIKNGIKCYVVYKLESWRNFNFRLYYKEYKKCISNGSTIEITIIANPSIQG